MAILLLHGQVDQRAAAVAHLSKEGIVDRGEHSHLIAGRGQGLQRKADHGDDTDAVQHLIRRELPVVAALIPGTQGGNTAGRRGVVTERRVVAALFQRGLDLRHHREIHICDPHRRQIRVRADAEQILYVPLYAGRAAAIDELVKVVH